MSSGGGSASSRARLLAVAILATAGCGGIRGLPTDRPGWLAYRVGELSIELPEDWSARGDPARIRLEPADGAARVTLERVERRFASEAECLADAERALARGAAGLERSRRHPTRLGGRPAVVQEGDRGGWHGWAWAACDRGLQYRLSFVGVSPMAPPIFAAQRGLEGSVRFHAGADAGARN
jgi:hypothetical protein